MNIIPKPLSVKELNGKVDFSLNTKISGDFKEFNKLAKDYLAKNNNGKENALVCTLDDKMQEEEYSIKCNGENIEVKAATEAGAFYALQTLIQLDNNNGFIPSVEILDKPKFGHRGFMLDSARHFWSVDKVKQFLDVMANIKMNRFHWHLTDDQGWRIEIKKYPLLATKGSIRKNTQQVIKIGSKEALHDNKEYGEGFYYTQDQLKEVVEYAKERHIEIIPEVDMPGHMVAAIACYPELSCSGKPAEVSNNWGIMDNILCVAKPEVMQFAKDIIDEVISIFPYKYFHIGGDEVPKKQWKENELCQKMIKDLGLKDEDALQGYFNNEIAKYLNSKGKVMVGWNEILDGANEMNKNIVAQWWINRKGNKNEQAWLANGGKMILSHLPYIYMDHSYGLRPLSKTYSYSAEKAGVKDTSNILGMEIPQWTEYIKDEEKLDVMTYPRLLTFSEVCWTAEENKSYDDFEIRLETMRDYFKKTFGFTIAHQKVYRGKTQPWYAFNAYLFWGKHPYLEVEKNRELMK